MARGALCAALLTAALAACQPALEPTLTPTRTLAPATTTPPTPTSTVTAPPTLTPTSTATALPTRTPTSTITAPPTFTSTPTAAADTPTAAPTPTLTPSALPTEAQPTASDTPNPTPTAARDPIARLRAAPILMNADTAAVRAIWASGAALGRRPDVFTTVGDSNTTNGDFMQVFGLSRDVCTWGDYAYLRETVAHFSAPLPTGARTSFTHRSAAARMGFNTAAVLDPFWAPSGQCAPRESPLLCEYRRSAASISVIMLGGRDVLAMDADTYRANMTQIVGQSIAAGVIPALTTFIVLPERGELYDKSIAFNLALLDIAESAGIPLINLWAAAEALPDHGIGPDRSHLKARVGAYCAFNGAERELGGTLRNLLTLQMLDRLRRELIAP
jgi:hypothetical protein